MPNEIYWVGYPASEMMTHRRPIPFKVLEENDTTLRIQLLADVPTIDGLVENDLPKKGDEFTIRNTYHRRGQQVKLTELLRSGDMAPWYGSEIDGKYFGGTIFPKEPNE